MIITFNKPMSGKNAYITNIIIFTIININDSDTDNCQ